MELLLLEHNLIVLNDPSSDPTFESSRGKSWIDLSIAGCNVADRISSWEVSNKETMSLHKSISFCLAADNAHKESVCFNYKKTDWDIFNSQLTVEFCSYGINEKFITNALPDTIENIAEIISDCITRTIENKVPKSKKNRTRTLVSWWNQEIANFRKKLSKSRKLKQSNASEQNIKNYKSYRNKSKNLIRKSKSDTFNKFCSTATDPRDLLHKLTSKPRSKVIPTLKKGDGTFTHNDQETCEFLLNSWFPDDDIDNDTETQRNMRTHVANYLNDTTRSQLPSISQQELSIVNKISPLQSSI